MFYFLNVCLLRSNFSKLPEALSSFFRDCFKDVGGSSVDDYPGDYRPNKGQMSNGPDGGGHDEGCE